MLRIVLIFNKKLTNIILYERIVFFVFLPKLKDL